MLSSIISRIAINPKIVDLIEFSETEQISFNGFSRYYTICALTKNNNILSNGYGLDAQPEISKRKALMEAIERFAIGQCFLESSDEPNGSAAHWFLRSAYTSAYAEALERDAVLRWMLGLQVPLSIRQAPAVILIDLATMDSLYTTTVVAACHPDFRCILFGMGCSKKQQLADEKAINELLLSVRRHQAQSCEFDNSAYGILHQRTCSKEFHDFIFSFHSVKDTPDVHSLSPFNPSHISREIIGCHLFPIRVVSIQSDRLLRWDLQWMLGLKQNVLHDCHHSVMPFFENRKKYLATG